MTQAQMATAINNTLHQIEAENRTKVIRDTSGENRILLGRDPKGNYVLAISKPTIDVVKALGA